MGDRTWAMPDAVWEQWVRRGRVPPDAFVLSTTWTRGLWRRAGSLEVYYLYAPAGAAVASPPALSGPVQGSAPGLGASAPAPASPDGPGAASASAPAAAPAPPAASGRPLAGGDLPVALWGRGFSATQALLLANLLISAVLVWSWRSGYSDHLWAFSGRLHERLFDGWVPALLPPLFLHASAAHLLGNMAGLAAGGAAVEEFYGRLRTFAFFLFAGLCGALLSLARPKEVLSVGASGGIMGLYGVVLVFLLRYRGRFSERQRMKTVRIYFPLLALALLPGLFQADLLSHVGGFVGGVLLALAVSPQRSRTPWLRPPAAEAGSANGPAGGPVGGPGGGLADGSAGGPAGGLAAGSVGGPTGRAAGGSAGGPTGGLAGGVRGDQSGAGPGAGPGMP